MSERAITCGAAGFGGVATSLFALAIELIRGKPLPNASFLLGLGILAFLGAVVGFLFEETNCRKAFFLGLGLPSLIQVGAATATRDDATPSRTTSAFALLPVAHADEGEAGIPGRTLKVRGGDGLAGYVVVFVSGDGRREEKVAVEAACAEKTLAVPAYGRRFTVQVGEARSASQPLSERSGGLTIVRVSVRSNPWSGLKQSIGIQRPAKLEVVLEPQVR